MNLLITFLFNNKLRLTLNEFVNVYLQANLTWKMGRIGMYNCLQQRAVHADSPKQTIINFIIFLHSGCSRDHPSLIGIRASKRNHR